ncbi:MAG: TRAP transporter substrate-binding protein [Rhodobacteraceae bacterium]|nr:TRAP transporter substrate-binding protein [Paracoccaceae bacterium]
MKNIFSALVSIGAAVALWATPSGAETTEVVIGAYVIPGSPTEIVFNDYAERLKAESKGALVPNMLIHGEGGAEEQVLTSLRRGRIHIASLSTLVLSNLIPELGLLSGPYLYNTVDEYDFVHDTYVLPRLKEFAAEKNLVALRWLDLGQQHIYAKKPILTPADIKGVPIRVSQDPAAKLFLEAAGADVIYLPSPDVIPALQTGLVEGGITPTVAYAQTGLTPEAPHFTLVGYTQIGNLLVVNKAWLDGLPPDLAEIVTSTFTSSDEIRKIMRTMERDELARQKEFGFTAHQLTRAQLDTWKAAAQGVNEDLIQSIGGRAQELYDLIIEGRTDYAIRIGG